MHLLGRERVAPAGPAVCAGDAGCDEGQPWCLPSLALPGQHLPGFGSAAARKRQEPACQQGLRKASSV